MGAARARHVVLDAGALIALERGDGRMTALLEEALRVATRFYVPAGVLAQVWRDGSRQARLAQFLKAPEVEVVPLSTARAKASGELCGLCGTRDVVDASVVVNARELKCAVVTSDAGDLTRLDPRLTLFDLASRR